VYSVVLARGKTKPVATLAKIAQEISGSPMKAPKSVDEQVGTVLRSRRLALGMSEEKLAAALGTSVRQLQEWQAGRSRIGAGWMLELIRILDVSPAFFFADSHRVH
jgi:DNA-binding transcriptional regulator YiaG